MLRKICNFILLFFMLAIIAVEAAAPMDQWSCSGEIRLVGDSSYKAFFLDDLIYRYAAADLSDLRIVDQDNGFVPYLIQSGFATEEVTEKSHQSVLQKSFRKKNAFYFDFAVLSDQNIDPYGSVLRIKLPNGEFLKEIDVYGSYDGVLWECLAHDQLYIVQNLIKDEVHLRRAEKYGFYRIIVLNNPEQLKIDGLDLIDRNYVANWSDFEKEIKLEYDVKHEPEQTMITLKNPNRLKIKQIQIEAEGNFKRTYRLASGPDDEITLITGEIYNFKFKDCSVTKTEIDLVGNYNSNSTLNLKIVNYDDRPLKIYKIIVKYYVDKVIFKETEGQAYRLYFGNPEAVRPRYDLEHFQSYLEKEEQDLVKVENYKVSHSTRTPEGENPRIQLVFNLIIGAVAVLLAIFVVKKLNTASN